VILKTLKLSSPDIYKYKECFSTIMRSYTLLHNNSYIKTIKVINVHKKSPLYNIGIKKGDIILRINGAAIKSSSLNTFCKTLMNNKLKNIIFLIKRKDTFMFIKFN
jgi:C-terminal processing protease CtpA/Prc